MANDTITSETTLTLSLPLATGTNVQFLNDSGVAGMLFLQNDAFNFSTNATTGLISAGLGGSVLDFAPGSFGIPGDEVTVQKLGTLFASLDVATTASSDNASFSTDIMTWAEDNDQFYMLPNGTVQALVPIETVTLNANTQNILDEIAQAVFGTAASADGATLDLSFALETNPNSNTKFVNAIFQTTNAAINPCFTAGTLILTTLGEIPVEDLKLGDMLITHDGGEHSIIWIGRREVDVAHHPNPAAVRPVIIEAGALGEGMPSRRLTISPDHALLQDGMLIPAKALLNWTSIRFDNHATRLHYYHLELARHDVIFANGTPAETFLDTGHRGVFDNAEATAIAHPALMQERRLARSCAALCTGGPALAAIRQRLAARQHAARPPMF